jgi:hypothetical protein
MCGTRGVNYTMCEHITKHMIPCDPELSKLGGRCMNSTYNEMHLGACPKCSGIATATPRTGTYLDRRLSQGPSPKETSDLTVVLNTQGKRTVGSIKKLVRSVSKKTILSRKNSKAKRVKQVGHSPGKTDTVMVPLSSEQQAEEYRSLLDEHPSLQETNSEPPHCPAMKSPDIETSTTWSGLMMRAMGTAGSETWGRESGRGC